MLSSNKLMTYATASKTIAAQRACLNLRGRTIYVTTLGSKIAELKKFSEYGNLEQIGEGVKCIDGKECRVYTYRLTILAKSDSSKHIVGVFYNTGLKHVDGTSCNKVTIFDKMLSNDKVAEINKFAKTVDLNKPTNCCTCGKSRQRGMYVVFIDNAGILSYAGTSCYLNETLRNYKEVMKILRELSTDSSGGTNTEHINKTNRSGFSLSEKQYNCGKLMENPSKEDLVNNKEWWKSVLYLKQNLHPGEEPVYNGTVVDPDTGVKYWDFTLTVQIKIANGKYRNRQRVRVLMNRALALQMFERTNVHYEDLDKTYAKHVINIAPLASKPIFIEFCVPSGKEDTVPGTVRTYSRSRG